MRKLVTCLVLLITAFLACSCATDDGRRAGSGTGITLESIGGSVSGQASTRH